MSEASSNGGSPNGATPGDREEPKLRLGGMALRNGLLIHGPTSWSAAARDRDGELQVASGPKPVVAPELAARVPLLRGPLRLAEAFVLIPHVRRSLPAARLPFEDLRVIGAGVAATAAGRVLQGDRPTLGRELAQAALGLAPALVALGDRDLAAYHGAEHKSIGGYETDEDAATVAKEHDRCGSNLIAPMILISAAGQVALDRALENPPPAARIGVGLASVSLAAELFAWSDRNPGTPLARAFHRPGREIQRWVATAEPTPEQLEVSAAALEEIVRVERAAAAPADPQRPPA